MLVGSISPCVGLIVNNEALTAGVIREPIVSVPKAIGAKPALTAMQDPDEDPRGFYVMFSRFAS